MSVHHENRGVNSKGTIDHGVGFDVVTLDNSLLEMLLTEIISSFRYGSVHLEHKHLKAAMIHILKMAMIYFTGFRTPAMRALGVKAFVKKRRHLHKYVFISTFLPFCYAIMNWYSEKLREKLNEIESTSAESATTMSIIIRKRACERQYKVLNGVLTFVRCFIHPFMLCHHLAFMFRLRPTPSIAMNMSGIQYDTDETSKRSVNLMYGYRRLWYEELLGTMSILPLDVWREMPKNLSLFSKHLMARMNSFVKHKLPKSLRRINRYQYDKLNQSCGICNIIPIPVPYEAGCGHLYCYTCLRIAVTDNIHYCCIICGGNVTNSRPFIPSSNAKEEVSSSSHTCSIKNSTIKD